MDLFLEDRGTQAAAIGMILPTTYNTFVIAVRIFSEYLSELSQIYSSMKGLNVIYRPPKVGSSQWLKVKAFLIRNSACSIDCWFPLCACVAIYMGSDLSELIHSPMLVVTFPQCCYQDNHPGV